MTSTVPFNRTPLSRFKELLHALDAAVTTKPGGVNSTRELIAEVQHIMPSWHISRIIPLLPEGFLLRKRASANANRAPASYEYARGPMTMAEAEAKILQIYNAYYASLRKYYKRKVAKKARIAKKQATDRPKQEVITFEPHTTLQVPDLPPVPESVVELDKMTIRYNDLLRYIQLSLDKLSTAHPSVMHQYIDAVRKGLPSAG